jgi:hypothetical protein
MTVAQQPGHIGSGIGLLAQTGRNKVGEVRGPLAMAGERRGVVMLQVLDNLRKR